MNMNQDCPCNTLSKDPNDRCHPYLRTLHRSSTPAGETADENCLQQSFPCNSCCVPESGTNAHGSCRGEDLHYGQISKTEDQEENDKHLHCVAHSCPLGTIVCCSNRNKNDCDFDKHIIKASELGSQEDPNGHRLQLGDSGMEEMPRREERLCCAKNTSWTEPRICRCDLSNPMDTSHRCECECGATVIKESKSESKKKVHFDEEVTTYVDCDKAFRNLKEEDVKELCNCCKECALKGQEQCIGKPVLVYDLPKPKFEGTSVTHKDFCWQKIPEREVPPWHPNIKDRWHHIQVPSIAETTYRCDYKPPIVFHAKRKPVYLAPFKREEKIDPCQKLAEEYSTWKKTSTGPQHVYHSSCDLCDRDLHRVHLHECNVACLPPQYQCHGDGHICEPSYHTVDKFVPCETGDAENSRYWWKRSGCEPEKCGETTCVNDLPPDLMKPACPGYTTNYKHDFKNPKKMMNQRSYLENCADCEYCVAKPSNDPPKSLCTKDPNQPFITQQAGII